MLYIGYVSSYIHRPSVPPHPVPPAALQSAEEALRSERERKERLEREAREREEEEKVRAILFTLTSYRFVFPLNFLYM